jgi:hypothetical protein
MVSKSDTQNPMLQQCVLFDIETVPAEELHLPTDNPDSNIDIEHLLKGTAHEINVSLSSLSQEELRLAYELELLTSNRKTVANNIKSALGQAIMARSNAIKQASVDPWKCRIVALVMKDNKHNETHKIFAQSDDEERELLTLFSKVTKHRHRLSWGGYRFDDVVIMTRSAILNVPIFPIDRGPIWRNTQHTDLSVALGDLKLETAIIKLNIPWESEMDGSMVYDAYQLGRFQEILDYCEQDVLAMEKVAEIFDSRIIWR